MHTKLQHMLRMGAPVLLVAALLGSAAFVQSSAPAALGLAPVAAPQVVTLPAATCTSTGPTTRTCDLWATTGSLVLPGGASVTFWGYADTAIGAAQLPGPMLIVNQGETVTVNLTNNLAEASALLFQGQDMIPDTVGAAATGGTATYTFTASNPGTYLYEAGLLPNAQHQVAMGLFGTLIVRPTGVPNQAYDDPATAFDDEALVVLSELDPALNNSANPATFDMRDYKPKYWLINGKAYPDTDPITIPSPAAGRQLLLRYINAGLQHHTMSLLGLDQTLLATDGSPFPYMRSVVAETIAPGQTADMIASMPASADAPGGMRYALYDANLLLHNNGALTGTITNFGGMLTFVTVLDGVPVDTGPATSNVVLSPNPADGSVDVAFTATTSDAFSGNSTIAAAEYFIDAQGADGSGMAMQAADGAFDSPTENISATITIAALAALPSGDHIIYVHGQQAGGLWGSFNYAVLNLDKLGPTTTGLTLIPNPSGGDVDVALSGTGDDTATGNDNIVAGEYFIDTTGPGGTGTPMTVNVLEPVASLDAVIPAATMGPLSEGIHPVYVHSQDASGHWGSLATIDLMVDKTGPDTTGVTAAPNPNNGSLPVNLSQFYVRVDAMLGDPLSSGVQSNLKTAEFFFDYQGPTQDPDGSGAPMYPRDGLFNSTSEEAYALIPLVTINVLTEGIHTIDVHGQDASSNWGAVTSINLIIDKTTPTVSNVSVIPNPSGGSPTVTLTASASDSVSPIAVAEWYMGADPGPGNGTPMAAADGTFNSLNEGLTATIDVSTWADGNYTLYVRARDAAGNWSLTVSTILVVSP